VPTEDGQDASPPSPQHLQHFFKRLDAKLELTALDRLRSSINAAPVAADFQRLHVEAMRCLFMAIHDNEVDRTEADMERYYFNVAVPRTLEAIRRDYYFIVDATADLANRTRGMARSLVYSTGDNGEELLWHSAQEFLDQVRGGGFPNWGNPGVRYKYFVTILRRKAWKFVDEVKRRRERERLDPAYAQDTSPGSDVMWHDPTGDYGSVSWLDQRLKELPQKEQEVLFLHFWDGFTVTEIARELRVARSTVYDRLANALARAEELLTGTTGR
jgi:RNA polymerase sigma factor (sigma-70 family)